MELGPGDVLLMDRRADEPIGFLIQDKQIFSGFPCVADGQYGLQIVAPYQVPAPNSKRTAAESISAE